MIKYKIVERKFRKKGVSGEFDSCYMAQAVQSGVADAEELGNRLCHSSSMTRGDVLGVISGLLDEMRMSLFNGETIKLDGIGSFSISATGDKCKSPEEVTPSKVRAKRICFRAAKSLRTQLVLAKFGQKK